MRADMEGEGHLVSQSAIGIAFRAAKRSFDIAASVVGMVFSRRCFLRLR